MLTGLGEQIAVKFESEYDHFITKNISENVLCDSLWFRDVVWRHWPPYHRFNDLSSVRRQAISRTKIELLLIDNLVISNNDISLKRKKKKKKKMHPKYWLKNLVFFVSPYVNQVFHSLHYNTLMRYYKIVSSRIKISFKISFQCSLEFILIKKNTMELSPEFHGPFEQHLNNTCGYIVVGISFMILCFLAEISQKSSEICCTRIKV